MKKLLVIVMALMPSLSILSFAQNPGGGFDPSELPIKSVPGPSIPDPRFSPNGDLGYPRPRSGNTVQDPYCYHSAGVVYMEADSTITYFNGSVIRYDDNQAWSNVGSLYRRVHY